MLGTFHTIIMFMAVINKRFKDAGLRGLVIQSGLQAEGSVDKLCQGKCSKEVSEYTSLRMKPSFLCFWMPWNISTKTIARIGPLSKMVKL